MISEQDQISYIIQLIKDEKNAARTELWELLGLLALSGFLAFMTFRTGWSVLLFGLIVYAIVGSRNGLEAKIRETERKRAVAYFEGDLEELREK
jgi:hypothetical protein